MFGIKSRKRIKELEAILSVANKTNFDLSAVNDMLKNNLSMLISQKSGLSIQIKELKEWREQHETDLSILAIESLGLRGEIDKLIVENELDFPIFSAQKVKHFFC